jgi:hypothetical protein
MKKVGILDGENPIEFKETNALTVFLMQASNHIFWAAWKHNHIKVTCLHVPLIRLTNTGS